MSAAIEPIDPATVEVDGKSYEVSGIISATKPCKGCAFFGGIMCEHPHRPQTSCGPDDRPDKRIIIWKEVNP